MFNGVAEGGLVRDRRGMVYSVEYCTRTGVVVRSEHNVLFSLSDGCYKILDVIK